MRVNRGLCQVVEGVEDGVVGEGGEGWGRGVTAEIRTEEGGSAPSFGSLNQSQKR